jgi:K+-sensing histidine kinase KdpD
MKKIIAIAFFAIIAITAACQAEELKAQPPAQQEVQKQPTLQDYQNALIELRGKQSALDVMKQSVEREMQGNIVMMDRVNTKIIELTPKPPQESKAAEQPAKKK